MCGPRHRKRRIGNCGITGEDVGIARKRRQCNTRSNPQRIAVAANSREMGHTSNQSGRRLPKTAAQIWQQIGATRHKTRVLPTP